MILVGDNVTSLLLVVVVVRSSLAPKVITFPFV